MLMRVGVLLPYTCSQEPPESDLTHTESQTPAFSLSLLLPSLILFVSPISASPRCVLAVSFIQFLCLSLIVSVSPCLWLTVSACLFLAHHFSVSLSLCLLPWPGRAWDGMWGDRQAGLLPLVFLPSLARGPAGLLFRNSPATLLQSPDTEATGLSSQHILSRAGSTGGGRRPGQWGHSCWAPVIGQLVLVALLPTSTAPSHLPSLVWA